MTSVINGLTNHGLPVSEKESVHKNHSRFSVGPANHCGIKCKFIPEIFFDYVQDKSHKLLAAGTITTAEHEKIQSVCTKKNLQFQDTHGYERNLRNNRLQEPVAKTPEAKAISDNSTKGFVQTSLPPQSVTGRVNQFAYQHPFSINGPVDQMLHPSYYQLQQHPSCYLPLAVEYSHYPAQDYPSPRHQSRRHYPEQSRHQSRHHYPDQHYPFPQQHYPYPGQPYPGQPYPGQPYPGQPYPGQPYPGPHFPRWPSGPVPSTPQAPAPQPIPVPAPQPHPAPAPDSHTTPTKPKPTTPGQITKPVIRVFDCNHTENTDGAKEIDIKSPPADLTKQVKHVVETEQLIHDIFFHTYGRNGWDDNNGQYLNNLRFSNDMFNAFWDGKQMVYGEPTTHMGDDGVADMTDPGVIAHEVGHSMNGFVYQGDSGAWEESKADINSLIFLHKKAGITKPATASEEAWMLGDSLVKDLPGPNGKQALRRADKPGFASHFDIQELGNHNGKPHISAVRANAQDRNVVADHGGVHVFSSLSTYVFYLTTIAINEPIYERPAKLWYAVCSNPSVKKNSNWQELADATVAEARKMGYNDIADQLVKNWGVVGIHINDRKHLDIQHSQVAFTHLASPYAPQVQRVSYYGNPIHHQYAEQLNDHLRYSFAATPRTIVHHGLSYYGTPQYAAHVQAPAYYSPRYWVRG